MNVLKLSLIKKTSIGYLSMIMAAREKINVQHHINKKNDKRMLDITAMSGLTKSREKKIYI